MYVLDILNFNCIRKYIDEIMKMRRYCITCNYSYIANFNLI